MQKRLTRASSLAEGTRGAYTDSIKPIRQYFVKEIGDPTVESVRARDIVAFLAWRRVHRLDGEHPLSNRTLQKDRAVLHRLFAYADRLEWRDGNPVARTETPKSDGRDPVILTAEQFDALLTACPDRPMLSMYLLTLAETGGRCASEALWLTWDDISLEENFIRVVTGRGGHRTKAGKSRWVPMTQRLAAAMREHFARYRFAAYNGAPTPWVFHHELAARHYRAGDRIKSLYDSFRNAVKRAKLPRELTQHDLRHRRVTSWLAEGKSPVLVKEAMGHSDIRTTMGYTHLAKEHLRALVEPSSVGWDEKQEKRANVSRDVSKLAVAVG